MSLIVVSGTGTGVGKTVTTAAVAALGVAEPVTRFLVYRDARVYFEGAPEEIAATHDAYLKRFLV